MKIKRRAADRWFSKCVRERAEWKCENCGKDFMANPRGLECSHYFSRRHKATRLHPDNAAAHCFKCHMYFTGNPVEFTRWIENHLGPALLEIVRDLHNTIFQMKKKDWSEAAEFYRKQYVAMIKARGEGKTGRLEFDSWQ